MDLKLKGVSLFKAHVSRKELLAVLQRILQVLVVLVFPISTFAESRFLVEDGKARSVIVLDKEAIPAERTAAQELADYLLKISGAKVRIVEEEPKDSGLIPIYVGRGKAADSYLAGVDFPKLGSDGIVIKSVGDRLFLTGGRPRGTLYAVYSFLSDELGVQWWTPYESTIPTRETIPLKQADLVYIPPISIREIYSEAIQKNHLFAARMKINSINGADKPIGMELGGFDSILFFVHSFYKLLPPTEYFDAHPEWYTDFQNGGKPATSTSVMPHDRNGQLCLMNKDVRREMARRACAYLRENPQATMITISQNDNGVMCTCPEDTAMAEAEGSPSGALIDFVNEVAEEIEKEFPNVLVETLAYDYTRKAPRTIRPRENVVIRLCTSGDPDRSRPIANSSTNEDLARDFEEWSRIANKLYVWDYTVNFKNFIFPHPNIQTFGPNISFFRKNHAIGIYEESDFYSNGTGDFIQMRNWLLSQLLWNPDLDQHALEEKFLTGYYGAAAPFIRSYLDLIRDAFLSTGESLSESQKKYDYLTLDIMREAEKAFDKAEAAVADNATLTYRVKRARLPLQHAWVLRYPAFQQGAKGVISGAPDQFTLIDRLLEDARTFRVGFYSQHESFRSYMLRVKGIQQGPQTPLPKELVSQSVRRVIDFQQDLLALDGPDRVVLTEDSLASDGKAAMLFGNHHNWSITAWLDELQPKSTEKWQVFLVARVKATRGADKTKVALECGIYSRTKEKPIMQMQRTLGEMSNDNYVVLDLGVHTLDAKDFVWVAPRDNTEVDGIYIDRILLMQR